MSLCLMTEQNLYQMSVSQVLNTDLCLNNNILSDGYFTILWEQYLTPEGCWV